MEARLAAEKKRQRDMMTIWISLLIVVLIAGIVVGVRDLRRGSAQSALTSQAPATATDRTDLFAGLTPLPATDEEAGWVTGAPSSPRMARWLGISNADLMTAFNKSLAHEERSAIDAKLPLRSIDWVSRLRIPPPVPTAIGDRRAVIVGQVHAINGSDPNKVELRPDVVACQREIYRFLLRQDQERDDLSIVHEGVMSAHLIRPENGNKGLAPYIAGVQFAVRHEGIEQLPGEDEDIMNLGDAIGSYLDPDEELDSWTDAQQIAAVEMRSRYMARVMAETLNRGRTPILVVGDSHEAGVAITLNGAGYRVAIWQPTVVRAAVGQ